MAGMCPPTPLLFHHAHAGCPSCGLLAWCRPAGLNALQTDQLFALAVHRRVAKRGEFLHHAGAALKSLHVIRSGSVKSCIKHEDGREQITGISFSGGLTGTEAIDGGKYLCDVVALEESTACRVPFGEFERLSRSIPALQRHFNAAMGREISRNYGLMLQLGSMSAEQRVAFFLLGLSEQLASRGYSSTKFNLQLSRMEIGSYLGLQLETVSRVLSRFSKNRLVAVNHRYTEIRNPGGLRKLTGECQNIRAVH